MKEETNIGLVQKSVISWSGGKDSALSYYEANKLEKEGRDEEKQSFNIAGILTTVTQDYGRISMHGVRRELLQKQTEAMGVPLHEVLIPKDASNEVYETQMSNALLLLKRSQGISTVFFGDLFLQDIRDYREKFIHRIGMKCKFPIWGRDTMELAHYFIDTGFKAIICCVDPKKLGREYCGREFDGLFLSDIPEGVDPCGENGEFHTFVYAGPIFNNEILVRVGEIVEKEGFYFADILPVL